MSLAKPFFYLLLFSTNYTELNSFPSTADRSRNRLYDMSDMIRQAVIARFGGVYLDSDIIVLRTLPELPANYIVAEDDRSVNAAVLRFHKGHALLLHALKELVS